MPQTDQEIIIQSEQLHEFAYTLYTKAGVSHEHAQLMADLQVETDLRGVHSHGTRMIPWYVGEILKGNMNATPNIQIVREGPSFAVIDGDNGLGHPPSALAMKTAIEKAKSTGIAAAGVRNAGHFGAAGCYSLMAARENLIGFSTTNTGGPSVAAPGSAQSVVANNAMSYAIPAGDERPIVLDMACGASSWGKVRTLAMYGKPIPPDWLLTSEGLPTTDADEGRILQPAAGPRGYGLALTMGTLAGPLIGGLLACHKRQDENSEHFFIAIDVASFADFDEYTAEMEKGVGTIHAAKAAEGVEQVLLPGEPEWRNYEQWIESGIPIHVDHLSGLEGIAKELGVEVFWK
jgi:LDH2 family malate/lactate/ureidoglycolate dehydrogenase